MLALSFSFDIINKYFSYPMSDQVEPSVEAEEKATLTFEGADYLIEDLKEDSLRILGALRESDAAIARHRSELTLITIARKSLISDLREALASDAEE